MDVSTISASNGGAAAASQPTNTPQAENLRNANTAVRQLNDLNISDREYAVVRDPASQRFVVIVREKGTGTVLDQFPPEDILQLLSQLSSVKVKQTGEASE